MSTNRSASLACAAASCLALACGQGASNPPPDPKVTVFPVEASVAAGATQQFTASIDGEASDAVLWSVLEPGGGSVDASGMYTAPAALGTYHVVVTSSQVPRAKATATVTVLPGASPAIAVAISPKVAALQAGASQQFTASVTGTENLAVSWSIQEAQGGSVDAQGLYTAPPAAGTYHVVATSVADSGKSDSAVVSVAGAPALTVAIAPAAVTLETGAPQQFSATVTGSSNTAVTWSVLEGSSGGDVSAAGLYTAPSGAGTYHVVATSQADTTRSAQATVTVRTPAVPGVCQPMAVDQGLSVDGYLTDRYSWYDADCQPRSADLIHHDVLDPHGHYGGYLRVLRLVQDGAPRSLASKASWRYNGLGYTVNHFGSGTSSVSSRNQVGTQRVVFAGPYHAVHEFKHTMMIDGEAHPPGHPLDITVHWAFATGRSEPLWSVTHDATPSGPGVISCDARGPYQEFNFEAPAAAGSIKAVEWGTRKRFVQTSTPETAAASWTWTDPNTIPYTRMTASAADAEMGEVQTQSFDDHMGGSDYGSGQTAACEGRTSASPGSCNLWTAGGLPGNYLWPFQLNNWELGASGTTSSHKMAWGNTLGSVGASSFNAWGRTETGYPYDSYAIFFTFGKESAAPTRARVSEMETVYQTAVSASVGAVATSGPGGVARSDSVSYNPPGWNHAYAVWELVGAANKVTASFVVGGGGALRNPIIRVRGWSGSSGPARVLLDGQALVEGTDFFPSVDTASGVLWLTVRRNLTGAASLSIE